MGIKAIPSDYNDHCPRCFDSNKSPEQILVSFSAIKFGDAADDDSLPPPNTTVYLHQTGVGCEWTGFNSLAYLAALQWFETDSRCNALVSEDFFAFVSTPEELCVRHFTSEIVSPIDNVYYGGFAVVLTASEIESAVESIMTVEKSDARYEITPGPDEIVIVRYASKKQRTNIQLEIPIDSF